jgi:hypothetical protein
VREYAEQMRRNVTETFVEIDSEWSLLGHHEPGALVQCKEPGLCSLSRSNTRDSHTPQARQ